ncbi:hypothetical protein [Streptomyces lasiicapitis]|uniref:SH3 domain-containing protein n=1 Tax=Streptomyces lasiicapitis TaxID=1923961 RepID=A0ABQ2LK56_9ACTN|nr:hypothetical protein [Streptomyces lasiicapitis]GGO35638.1 hypothetical protein GCM10012286_06630 [Streptomyces lasiicapitis]
MTYIEHLLGVIAAAALSLLVAIAGIGATHPAGTVFVKASGATSVSCTAAKVRDKPEGNSLAHGIGYRGEEFTFQKFALRKSERAWYSYGTVTRKSDGKKVHGYIRYECGNPHGSYGAPLPKNMN